jgi:hypothetical protein
MTGQVKIKPRQGLDSNAYFLDYSTIREKANWKIHLLYVANDFKSCLKLIEEQMKECHAQCEYPIYIKALIMRQQVGWS